MYQGNWSIFFPSLYLCVCAWIQGQFEPINMSAHGQAETTCKKIDSHEMWREAPNANIPVSTPTTATFRVDMSLSTPETNIQCVVPESRREGRQKRQVTSVSNGKEGSVL